MDPGKLTGGPIYEKSSILVSLQPTDLLIPEEDSQFNYNASQKPVLRDASGLYSQYVSPDMHMGNKRYWPKRVVQDAVHKQMELSGY